jgi:hypothetical protein
MTIEHRVLYCPCCSHIERMLIDLEDMPPACPACDAPGVLEPASPAQIAFRASELQRERCPGYNEIAAEYAAMRPEERQAAFDLFDERYHRAPELDPINDYWE